MSEHFQHNDEPIETRGPRLSRRRLIGGVGGAAVAGLASVPWLTERAPIDNREQPFDLDERFPHLRWAEQALHRKEEYSLKLSAGNTGPFISDIVEYAMLTHYEEMGISEISVSITNNAAKTSEHLTDPWAVRLDIQADLARSNWELIANKAGLGSLVDFPEASYVLTTRISNEEMTPLPMHDDLKLPKIRGNNTGATKSVSEKSQDAIDAIRKYHDADDSVMIDPGKVAKRFATDLNQSLQFTAQVIQERMGNEASVIATARIIGNELEVTYTTLELLEQKAKAEARKFTLPVSPEEAGRLSDSLTETADRLISPEMFKKLRLDSVFSPGSLEELAKSQSLTKRRQRTEHGVKQAVNFIDLQEGGAAEQVDMQVSQLSTRDVIISSELNLFLGADGQLAPNATMSHRTALTRQQCIETIQELAGVPIIEDGDVIEKDGYLTAAPLVNGQRINYHVHPNGHVRIFDYMPS